MAGKGLSHSQKMNKTYSRIGVDTAQTTLGGFQSDYFSLFLKFAKALKKAGYEI